MKSVHFFGIFDPTLSSLWHNPVHSLQDPINREKLLNACIAGWNKVNNVQLESRILSSNEFQYETEGIMLSSRRCVLELDLDLPSVLYWYSL